MKKAIALLLSLTMLIPMESCKSKNSKSDDSNSISDNSVSNSISESSNTTKENYKYEQYASMTPEEIVAGMTLEQKVAQMLQPAVYNITEDDMRENNYGSILS